MSKRSYNQYCGLAAALDVLGERWSMLILRNLLTGPKRFTDFLEGLPGIGTGLLSERLKQLESAGVIRRATLPPPAASAVYELTADGEALRPVLIGLTRWGMARLGEPPAGQFIDADMIAVAMEARFEAASDDIDGSFQLVIDGRPYRIRIAGGKIVVQAGPSEDNAASFVTDTATLVALNNGTGSLTEALAAGNVRVDGDVEAAMRVVKSLNLPV
jgi:DNA-binding HxlR family transcriptional regulator/putative sterol carrier protein